ALVRVQQKCLASLKRPEDLGHQLRQPEADNLRVGIYKLRASYQRSPYRMLHFISWPYCSCHI
ncbi:MAG TPA: hypothetical protein VMX16_02850, partial [Terriglobia bacterium]|nr:hypothetical protein [Terriglobia bacterium]